MKNDRIETNLKIVKGGKDLELKTKVILLSGGDFETNDLQKVCSLLSYHHGIPATPYPINSEPYILVNEQENLINLSVNIKRGTLKFKVNFIEYQRSLVLDFKNPAHRYLIADLYKRAFLTSISKTNKYWTFDSPRIFYDKKPFKKIDEISVFRRFEVSDIILDDGIAISVDVGTTFFTNKSVDYFFTNGLERKFKKLTSRQEEQKGTLLYKTPRGGYSKCYFVKYDNKVSCESTHSFEYDGNRYDNLFDYYQKINKKYAVLKEDKVAYVSFPNLNRSLPVAANKLFIRVMNDMLPYELNKLDKINPIDRKKLLDEFWKSFGRCPFGKHFEGLHFGGRYFLPFGKSGKLDIPNLIFNRDKILKGQITQSKGSYKSNFRDRRKYLINEGCYFTPWTITREIHFVYPDSLKSEIAENFADDVCDFASKLTDVSIEPIIESYSDYREKLNSLNQEDGSMVVFIFEHSDPATYFIISHELKNWSVKRVTTKQLQKKHDLKELRKRNWHSFIELNTYDILQQLGCVLWACPPLHFDIHLAIDVSEKFTHFCFSFYMFNDRMEKPIIKTDTFTKTNHQEKINRTILENKLNNLFDRWNNDLISFRPKKMLITRDGKVCDGECEAFEKVINNQISKGNLSNDFNYDVIEYHKSSLKGIRLWNNGDLVENVLEGTYFIKDANNGVLVPTGAATLNQGTAHPILVKKVIGNAEMKLILQDLFSLNQLNYSSPTVAQGYCLPIKRADDQLKDRRMQEVERIK